MKKITILAFLCCSLHLGALPIGNPMDASLYSSSLFWGDCTGSLGCDSTWHDILGFRFGFCGDYVFDRHVKQIDVVDFPANNFIINTNSGLFVVNLCNRADIFGTLGASSILYSGDQIPAGTTILKPTLVQTEGSLAWSLGGRLTLWSWEGFTFGVAGQYARSHQNLSQMVTDSRRLNGNPYHVGLMYSEWQVSLGLAYLVHVGCSGVSFIPYAGIKWAGLKGTWSHTEALYAYDTTFQLYDLSNSKNWGWGAGFTFLFCDVATCSVEVRWADEIAGSLNAQFRF